MASGDYDGDGKTDFGVARPVPTPGSAGDKHLVWYILLSSNQSVMVRQFGGYFAISPGDPILLSDFVAPADYDGDGKTDVAVYRPRTINDVVSSYYILQSSNNQVRGLNWGFENDSSANFGLYNAAGQNAQY